MRVTIQTSLAAAPARVWEAVKQVDTLLYITRGLLGFNPTASNTTPFHGARWHTGDTVEARLWLFNRIPLWTHTLRIVRIDEAAWEIESRERGGVVTQWNHLIRVEHLPDGRARYTDQLDIDAGVLTIGVVLFAHLFYRYRQMRWHKLVRQL
ncbi:MAG: hypothetical protein HZC41_09685 [Chloroflexi bacterium]|nr:hypothetical protein [Chloroflexota bacterium]